MAMVETSVNVSAAYCFFASTKHSLQLTRQPPQSQLNLQQLISHFSLALGTDTVTPGAQAPDVNGQLRDERWRLAGSTGGRDRRW